MSPWELRQLLAQVARAPVRAPLSDELLDALDVYGTAPEPLAETTVDVVWICNLVGHATEGRLRHIPGQRGPCLMGRCVRCGVGWYERDHA